MSSWAAAQLPILYLSLFNNKGSKSCKTVIARALHSHSPSSMPHFFFFLDTVFPSEESLTLVMHWYSRPCLQWVPKGTLKANSIWQLQGRTPMLCARTTRAQTGTAWLLNFEEPVRNVTVCLLSKLITFFFYPLEPFSSLKKQTF